MDLVKEVLQYAGSANYIWLFIIYLIEGPIANLISAMVASTGVLDIWYVFVLAATAEALADIFYFAIGRLAKGTKISTYLNEVEKRSKVFSEIKEFMQDSPLLMIFFVKMFPPIAVPGILYMGQEGMTWKTFIRYGVPISICRNAIISLVGFRLMLSIESLLSLYGTYKLIVTVLSVIVFVILIFLIAREDFEVAILRYVKDKSRK